VCAMCGEVTKCVSTRVMCGELTRVAAGMNEHGILMYIYSANFVCYTHINVGLMLDVGYLYPNGKGKKSQWRGVLLHFSVFL
jgi:hypothetical protein